MEGLSKGDVRGDCKQDMEGDLLSRSGQVQVRSDPGLAKVTIQLKFKSLELDSDLFCTYFLKNHIIMQFCINDPTIGTIKVLGT